MHTKAVAAQTINYLGYNILFQNVEIVWYKDFLSMFDNKKSNLHYFDALFSRESATAPTYAANSAFWHIRTSDKTKHACFYLCNVMVI